MAAKEESMSPSVESRKRGNDVLRSSTQEGICHTLKLARLERAMRHYVDASNRAKTQAELASAHKNQLICHLRLIPLQNQSDDSKILYHVRSSLKHAADAIAAAKRAQFPIKWIGFVVYKTFSLIADFAQSSERDALWFERLLSQTVFKMAESSIPGLSFISHYLTIKKRYNAAVTEVHDAESRSQYHLKETHFPLEECKRRSHHPLLDYEQDKAPFFEDVADNDCHYLLPMFFDTKSELHILESDIAFLTSSVESLKCIREGDGLISSAVHDFEDYQLELVWSSVDCYRQAIVCAKEIDVECEAVAVSKLGCVFADHLGFLGPGNKFCNQAISLSFSLFPKDCSQEPWFKEAKRVCQAWQERVTLNDQKKEEERYAEVKERLKDEMAEIEKERTPKELLEFVYKNYPPKNGKERKEKDADGDDISVKQQLKQSLIHYHIDKNKEFGLDWEVLCLELYKKLASEYEKLKV